MALSDPVSGGLYLKPADLLGHVLLFARIYSVDMVPDQFNPGQTRCEVIADVVDLDGERVLARKTIANAGITSGLAVGKQIVGKIVQRAPSAPGRRGAFVLDPVGDQDKARAQAWLDGQGQQPTTSNLDDLAL